MLRECVKNDDDEVIF